VKEQEDKEKVVAAEDNEAKCVDFVVRQFAAIVVNSMD